MTEINAIIILHAYEIGLCLLGPHRPTSLQPCLSPELGSLVVWVETPKLRTLPTSFLAFLGSSRGTGYGPEGQQREMSDKCTKLGPQHFAGALTCLACPALGAIHPEKALERTLILSKEGCGPSVAGMSYPMYSCYYRGTRLAC